MSPEWTINGTYPFERPVIILAAPRSGSTLLFEILMKSTDFWTIGDESHALFESIDRFNPVIGMCDSNALNAADATPAIIDEIRQKFFRQLRNCSGQSIQNQQVASPRLLEKTPKNALRVSLLDAVFPDALFIYLYRNPRENISSIMDAWQSGRFVTYPRLPGRSSPWSLLLPPGWQSYNDAPLEQIAAFQWRVANASILGELGKLSRSRWMAVSYQQQAHDPASTARKICEFCDVSPDAILDFLSAGRLPFSRYTLTPPSTEKWHKNAPALSKVIPDIRETVDYVRQATNGIPDAEFDLTIDSALTGDTTRTAQAALAGVDSGRTSRRNQRCPCGSGKKYKHCHGDLRRQGEQN